MGPGTRLRRRDTGDEFVVFYRACRSYALLDAKAPDHKKPIRVSLSQIHKWYEVVYASPW